MRKILRLLLPAMLFPLFVSCDQGEPQPGFVFFANDTLQIKITDQDGNNLLDPKSAAFSNSDIIFDTHYYLHNKGKILPIYYADGLDPYFSDPKWDIDIFAFPSHLKWIDATEPYLQLRPLAYPDCNYEFDLISPLNKYQWHFRLQYRSATTEYHYTKEWQYYVNEELVELNRDPNNKFTILTLVMRK